ncbi:MAG: excinuclease ABC subunit UvrA [Ignavibacteria bacterium]|nr:excinuclease ABC subunit UvrA [Ignavibacteria bacterium]
MKLDARKYIIIKGAKVNNLKNISLNIPKYKFIVVTGVSGSGKSSLVFDTIYAEGQRRYVESLSAYARQFLEKMNKPDVDSIEGLAPSMAIEQRTGTRNSRSTVGTSTEIYDYLRLLFARIGITYSPISNTPVYKNSPETILQFLKDYNGCKIMIICKLKVSEDKNLIDGINSIRSKGFYKIICNNELIDINEIEEEEIINRIKKCENEIRFLIDRLTYKSDDEEIHSRVYDALEMAFKEGYGYLTIRIMENDKFIGDFEFNQFLEKDGIKFEEPEPRLFSFNNPYGACKRCQGFSKTIDIDYDLVIPDKNKSIIQGAILPFTTPKFSKFQRDLLLEAEKYNVDIEAPYRTLSQKEKDFIFNGGKRYIGLINFFKMIEKEASYKLHYRILLNKYRAYTTCSLCNGSRLRKEALYVRINDKNIHDIVRMKISEAYNFFKNLKLTDYEKKVAGRILEEIITRLKYLNEVGLSYLTLDRISFTLSGGEAQRINLSTSLGSSLVGSIYVLDEPTIGLHPSDTHKLIKIMKSLRDIGNTVIVVEHDKEVMSEADEIIDMGLLAGENGGEVIFQGKYKDLLKDKKSLTGRFLSGRDKIKIPNIRRKIDKDTNFIIIKGARENNLKDLTVKIPLNMFVCVTGVSGSGKSSLIHSILYNGLKKQLEGFHNVQPGEHDSILGVDKIDYVELVDQSSFGRTSRSNPITYIKAFDEIRDIFAQTSYARRKGFSSGHFSFNVPGGRCEKCEGTGSIKVEMQFMADIYIECEACNGKRYKTDVLEVKVKGSDGSLKNIYEVLNMTVTEAMKFFRAHPKVTKRLKYLEEVGLGYLRLGQAGNTLSGGEAQRLKLAYHLAFQEIYSRTLFIFDEPTTGLHMYDIAKLLKCFEELLRKGNSLIVIEHNIDVIKCADYIIDLGPGSGDEGGYIVAEGTPEQVALNPNSLTGQYLQRALKRI